MNEEKVIDMLLKHDQDIVWIKENMATKQDLREIAQTQDEVLKFVKKMDTEMSAHIAHNKRVDARLDAHDTEILKLKQKVSTGTI